MKIGVFDSGIGGEIVANDLKKHFPNATITAINDRVHLPYGTKTEEQVINLTDTAIQPLIAAASDVIVIACNTATTIALSFLRKKYPDQLFVGIEPMIKTASELTRTNVVAVCATPATLKSKRYNELKKSFAADITVLEPDCSDWASMIEANSVDMSRISSVIADSLAKKADVIVLGCTHYHWIYEQITRLSQERAHIIEPTPSIARQITALTAKRPR